MNRRRFIKAAALSVVAAQLPPLPPNPGINWPILVGDDLGNFKLVPQVSEWQRRIFESDKPFLLHWGR